MRKLLVYYGWPKGINAVHESSDPLQKSAEIFSAYDYVVLGAGIELPSHGNHEFTKALLAHPSVKAVTFFGYVDLGVSTSHFSQEEIHNRCSRWAEMGAKGIFLDDFGFDFEVSRERQNQAVEYIHSLGLPVIANGWKPEDLFGSHVDRKYNPGSLPPKLGEKDFYLYESFQVMNGKVVEPLEWLKKREQLALFRKNYGFRIMGLTTNTSLTADEKLVRYTYFSALLDDFEALGWGMPQFAANGTVQEPPFPKGDWGSLSPDEPLVKLPKLFRRCSHGRIVVDTRNKTGKFAASLFKKG